MGASAACMYDTLWNSLMVKAVDLMKLDLVTAKVDVGGNVTFSRPNPSSKSMGPVWSSLATFSQSSVFVCLVPQSDVILQFLSWTSLVAADRSAIFWFFALVIAVAFSFACDRICDAITSSCESMEGSSEGVFVGEQAVCWLKLKLATLWRGEHIWT